MKLNCAKCQKGHLTLFHREKDERNWNQTNNEVPSKVSEEVPTSTNGTTGVSSKKSLCTALCNKMNPVNCSKTLLIDVSHHDSPSVRIRAYAIIDEHSNCTLVDDKLISYFDIGTEAHNYTLSTVNGIESNVSGRIVHGLRIKGVGSRQWIDISEALTNNAIPCTKDEVATRSLIQNNPKIAAYADKFHEFEPDAEVLILIGRDCIEAMGTKCHTKEAPWVHETPLGWALVGSACPQASNPSKSKKRVLRTAVITHEHFNIGKPPNPTSSPQFDVFSEKQDDEEPGPSVYDKKFCDIMQQGVNVNGQGNVEAPVPLKNEDPLPCNRWAVYYRTKNMLDRLKGKPKEMNKCIASIDASLKAGYIEQVPDSERDIFKEGRAWWLSIFAVWHPHKDKPRMVCDAAAKFEGVSLNDALLTGPDMNHQLRALLQNVREEKIAIMADVEAMFSNFSVNPVDRDLLRFYWWDKNDPTKEVVQYRSTSHVFGCSSSPAVASWCLLYCASLPAAESLVKGKDFIFNNCYVDDLIGSVATSTEGIVCIRQASEILRNVNVRLHKIMSNDISVLEAFPENDRAKGCVSLQSGQTEGLRTLGLMWDPLEDVFMIKVEIAEKKFTKRNVLATINSVYDPLGIVSPVTLAGRLIQRLVLPTKDKMTPEVEKCDWDDLLPEEYLHLWDEWKVSLNDLSCIKISRCLIPKNFVSPVRELMCFCDSSEKGLGYVVYMRSVQNEEIHVSFVLANSRVAPRAAVTMPRLELNAAVELVVRVSKLNSDLKIKPTKTVYFTDSKIVLGYINNNDKRFSKYVTRRIALIHKFSEPQQWEYISTNENPADLASRANTPRDLDRSMWVRGPQFLWEKCQVSEFPNLPELLPETAKEGKVLKTVILENSFISFLADKINDWLKLVGIVRNLLSLKSKLDQARQRLGMVLAPRNGKVRNADAVDTIIKLTQNDMFKDTVAVLNSGKNLPENNKLIELTPFIQDGILRVGGRIKNSSLPFCSKHPVLMPSNHPVTKILIEYYHKCVGHQGRHLTHAEIRMNGFHVLNGKSIIRNFLSDCNMCKRLRGPMMTQQMASLPRDRLEEVPPFCNTGLDVWGPVIISEKRATRSTSAQRKVWVLILVCLVSRAVHVEIIPSLDTTAFRNGLQRFISVRGKPKIIRSDNGTNFVSAHNQMVNVNLEVIESNLNKYDIEWMFNPPYASHFGGVYERKIGSIKRVLEGTMALMVKSRLNYDEFHTLLMEACAIVNNTPLTDISDDANDPAPITPASLLLLRGDSNPPDLEQFSERDLGQYGRLRHKRVQYLAEQFWVRWRKEFITTLHRRHKWKTRKSCVGVNDVVLVKNKSAKRNEWLLGRVIDCKKSDDGLVRRVTLRLPPLPGSTRTRVTDRCIQDLVLIVPSHDHPVECLLSAKNLAAVGECAVQQN